MRYRNRVLVLLFLLSIITYMDRVCIGLAGKRIQADLGLNESQLGWVLGIFALSYALFEIPSGSMGDRIGPRRVLTRIVLWWSTFTSLTGVVSNYYVLLGSAFCSERARPALIQTAPLPFRAGSPWQSAAGPTESSGWQAAWAARLLR